MFERATRWIKNSVYRWLSGFHRVDDVRVVRTARAIKYLLSMISATINCFVDTNQFTLGIFRVQPLKYHFWPTTISINSCPSIELSRHSLPPIRICNYNDLLVYEYFVIRFFLSRKKFTRFELNFERRIISDVAISFITIAFYKVADLTCRLISDPIIR